ncbi:phosphate/phosphite/phosphonate ABC transporter substrate-binding protein [Serratia sp. M24T3]|uniref:phosphate/phosphite/phosphonate ABC transporter substrate-binding protein n=1 Tax=Serratia sp. M24T3 TaxID=932213 RepID=UPI00025B9143|nr:PhnD/SsuA/transferrin family substrate-binding protein [Serratia sp. M24T3]EIC84335.1 hypothetical protein SPM24T3_12689 [Serratia sp. M24T3]
MNNAVSLPMYAVNPPDVDALWSGLRELMAEEGLTAGNASLSWPQDLIQHWQQPQLLLSQTCGYPLVTRLKDVQPLGCFHYSAPGCEGLGYRSFLVTRQKDMGAGVTDFRQRVVVCNSEDSQSGFNALRKMVEPLSENGCFFRQIIFSGSHRQSLQVIQQGEADIAAIDCVTFALLKKYQPQALAQLKVIGETPLTPGLPLITGPNTSADQIFGLRKALKRLVSEPRYQQLCRQALITGFSKVSRKQYDIIL